MTDLSTTTGPATAARPATWQRTLLRWMVSFAGYPVGGAVAILLTGPVDDLRAALAGGLVTGAVLGAVQAWAMGAARPRATTWTLASALGLMAGLGLGASVVDYRTGLADVALQGALCGLLLGIAQAAVLLPRLGLIALGWPVALAEIWALGWVTSTSIGIRVEEQFTVFGSSGALVAPPSPASCPSSSTAAPPGTTRHESPGRLRHRAGGPAPRRAARRAGTRRRRRQPQRAGSAARRPDRPG